MTHWIGRENINGFEVAQCGKEECARAVLAQLKESDSVRVGPIWLACFNPHSYAVSKKDFGFRSALHSADYLIPDGIGVVLASVVLGGVIRRRVTGFDFFQEMMGGLDKAGGGTVFFLGSSTDTLHSITLKCGREFPNVNVAGTFSPEYAEDFSEAQNQQMIAAINAVKPDILWVGLTAPKQEKWIFEMAPQLDVKFAAGIGAVFDFYIGKVRRSPKIFQRLGLEWLPRLLQEPRRLWRRTFVSAPIFCLDVFKSYIQKV